ncbi:MAG: MmcQ/YjbR family DNA-binding protein [Streptococcaceae bacterium]|jgi:predicted DNA-binding protein (MmcQ/YjbR family)|nr:MmcQ/YjbR family DNA-binding protein [Streptococcaceae bacterium]
MKKEELLEFCETLGPVYENTPFAKMEKDKTPTVAIRHLKNKKIFCYWMERPSGEFGLAVKLDPERAEQLREEYEAVTPAWHMNKTHWSDIKLGADLSNEQIFKLVEESYDLTK